MHPSIHLNFHPSEFCGAVFQPRNVCKNEQLKEKLCIKMHVSVKRKYICVILGKIAWGETVYIKSICSEVLTNFHEDTFYKNKKLMQKGGELNLRSEK